MAKKTTKIHFGGLGVHHVNMKHVTKSKKSRKSTIPK